MLASALGALTTNMAREAQLRDVSTTVGLPSTMEPFQEMLLSEPSVRSA